MTAKSDDIELLVHRPSLASWLESFHEVYMAEQMGRGMVRKREPSWSDLEPWMEEQAVASLPTIKERGPDAVIEEKAVKDELVSDGDDERPPEIPPELPPDDSLANIEEDPPPLPEEGPPSMIEDESQQQLPQDDADLPPDTNVSEDEKSNERTLDESTHSRGLHKEESFQGEPPLPPEGEPPLLTFDESSEELSWEQEHSTHQQLNTSDSPHSTPLHISGSDPPQSTPLHISGSDPSHSTPLHVNGSDPPQPTPLHISDDPPQSTPMHISDDPPQSTLVHSGDSTSHQTLQMTDEEPVMAQPKEAVDDATNTSISGSSSSTGEAAETGELSGGLPSANGLTVNEDTATKQPSSEHNDRLSETESLQLDTSLEQDNVFTITLRKGFRGLGFMLDKQRSLAEGM